MAEERNGALKDIAHDFLSSENERITLLIGFAKARKSVYLFYRGFIFLALFTVIFLILVGIVLVPKKTLLVDAVHYILLAGNALSVLTTRIIAARSLNNAHTIVEAGIYQYRDEALDEQELILKRSIRPEFKKKFNFFLTCQIFGLLSNQIIFPLSQLFLVEENDFENILQFMNPYLPHFLFVPFSTRTVVGYLAVHLFDTLCYFYMYSASLCFLLVYISCTVQVKVHLQVLQHSLKNIHKRAYLEYVRRGQHLENGGQLDDLFEKEEFQSCLYSCLRSNIQHHEAVLRLIKEAQPFLGAGLMYAFTLSAVFYAAYLYLISQKLPINFLIIYLLTFVAESVYIYQICVFGEEVIEESEKLFQTLYGIPWFLYGKRFNRNLHIMMSNTLKPLQIKAKLISMPACFETYGSLISGMYKVMNLVRHSDVMA